MALQSTKRARGTDRSGRSFSQHVIQLVWQKGRPIPDYDSNVWRRDKCGSVMKWSDYGNTNSQYGWEIDHIIPVAKGGSDDISNLQPLQWENNRRKGDSYPWYC